MISVIRVDSRLMSLRLLFGKKIINIYSTYAPQSGRTPEEKDTFFNNLLSNITVVPESEFLAVCGDLNGHVGKATCGFDGVHGNCGYGERNPEGITILDLCTAADLAVTNTFFTKSDSRLITYHSGTAQSQVDYILVRRSELKMVRDTKVIGSEECITQHKLLVCDLELQTTMSKSHPFTPKRRVWKLKTPEVQVEYEKLVKEAVQTSGTPAGVDDTWMKVKSCLLEACDKTCGLTKQSSTKRKETWWCNGNIEAAIKQKRKLWKDWQNGGSKELYQEAEWMAKSAVYAAKKSAQEEKFGGLQGNEERNLVFKIAQKMKGENHDTLGEKCVKDDDGNIAFDDEAKLRAWKTHYEKLLNLEFPWNSDTLTDEPPVQGPPPYITVEMVTAALGHMKAGKAAGPSGIVIEMIQAAGDDIIVLITNLINSIVREEKVPDDWNLSYIINCFKGKGDAMERGNFRGLKLLDQVLKAIERVLESIIRSQVNIDAMQFGFMPGRGTTDAIFILRQLHEKHRGKQKDLFFAFVDLEKAFDRIPRSVLWWAMRKLGVEEWIVRMVQAMYTDVRSSVRVNSKYSSEFQVKVGLHQGSVLSPILFIIVMEALSIEFRTGCPWELLYADDLVIVAESAEELIHKLKIWKVNLESKGLRVNMGKTKILCSSHKAVQQNKDSGRYPCGVCHKGVGSNSIYCTQCKHWIHKRCTDTKGKLKNTPDFKCKKCRGMLPPIPAPQFTEVIMDGEKLEVVETFCYLGDVTGQTGGCNDAITARLKSAWKKFRELLPIFTNRGISLHSRGHIFESCVRSVMLHASQTWPVTVEGVSRLIRNDNTMIRWICSTKLADRVPSEQLRSRLGLSSLEDALRWGRLRWFGHLERMDDECWPKKIVHINVDGSYPRGRPRKRWMDNVSSDLKHLRLEKTLAQDRVAWRKAIRPHLAKD